MTEHRHSSWGLLHLDSRSIRCLMPALLLLFAAGCHEAENDRGSSRPVTPAPTGISIGYRKYGIALGDHLDSVRGRIPDLAYSYESRYGNATGRTDIDTSSYFSVSEPHVRIDSSGTLNPSLGLLFDERKRLIRFSLIYIIDASDIDIKRAVIRVLGDSILPRIREWEDDRSTYEVRNETCAYRFTLDTSSGGAYRRMRYEVFEIIPPGG